MDLRTNRISNRLIGFGFLIAPVFQYGCYGMKGFVYYVINTFLPVILLFFLFRIRVLGAGDIKLFSMTGCFLNTEELLWLVFFSFIAAAFLGLIKLMIHKNLWIRLFYLKSYVEKSLQNHRFEVYEEKGNWDCRIHFAVAILLGCIMEVLQCIKF